MTAPAPAPSDKPERFTLANQDHLETFVGVLYAFGSLCPACGHGTRATSKRWGRCIGCGERVRRRTEAEVRALMAEAREQRAATTSNRGGE